MNFYHWIGSNKIFEKAFVFQIGLTKGIKHLSSGTFPSPAFPVTGTIHGRKLRYMVPLICQRAGKRNSIKNFDYLLVPHSGKHNSKSVFIWFLVGTGSPFTCLSVKSLESLYGEGNVTHARFDVTIQVCFLFYLEFYD